MQHTHTHVFSYKLYSIQMGTASHTWLASLGLYFLFFLQLNLFFKHTLNHISYTNQNTAYTSGISVGQTQSKSRRETDPQQIRTFIRNNKTRRRRRQKNVTISTHTLDHFPQQSSESKQYYTCIYTHTPRS